MTVSHRRFARPTALAAALLTATFALTACSDDKKPVADNTPLQTSASSTPLPSSTTSAAPTSTSTSTSTSTTSTTSKAPTTTTSSSSSTSTKPFNSTLATSCINATSNMNAVVREWNSATKSGRTSRLDDAAKKFSSTAVSLRNTGKSAKDAGFLKRADDVADELDKMKTARDNRKSVLTGDYNSAARELRGYCKVQLG